MWRAVPAAIVVLGLAFPAPAQGLDCGECHSDPETLLAAGQALGKTLSRERIRELVVDPGGCPTHMGMQCTDCHASIDRFPHPREARLANPCVTCHLDVVDVVNNSVHRDPLGGSSFVLQCWECHGAHTIYPPNDPRSPIHPYNVPEVCLQCHEEGKYLDGVHGQGVELAGLTGSATCISCHGAHDIRPVKAVDSRTARRQISFTCGQCHGSIGEKYRKSVHGAALMADDNPDVPTCVDCHQAHQTPNPRSPRFRASSPKLCGNCHADEKLMGKYGLSTEVFSTYVADFHGTTAELFQEITPDQPLNQAVCYDCHGYHDVYPVHDRGREQIEENLLKHCRACHPGATPKYLSAWTGHYVPSPDRYPWIYYVKLAYRILIPGVIGFFVLFIATDVYRTRQRRRQGKGGVS